MADYHEWKGLERRFRQLHKDRLELYAEGENGSWVVRGGVEGADGEERFGELAEHAAWVDSHRDEDGKNFFLNLLNEYLLRRNSKSIEISFVVVSAAPSTRKQGSKPAKQGFPEVSTALYGKQERLLDQPVKHVVDPETGDILGTILANQPELEAALIAEAKRRRAAHSGAHQRAASRPEAAVEIRTNRTGGLSYLRNDALAVAPPVLKNQAALPLAKTWNIYKIRSVGRLSADYCLGRALEARRRGKDSVAPQPQPGGAGKKPRQRNEKYAQIDAALKAIAEAKPASHNEVFRFLADRCPVYPHAEPFESWKGWWPNQREDHSQRQLAHVWLSKQWKRLGLSAFAPGPKKK